jgi:hypothetical protein
VNARIRSRRGFLLVTGYPFLVTALGCGQPSPPAGGEVAAAESAVPQSAAKPDPAPVPLTQNPPPPPQVFAFPADAAGRALPRVVTPAPPPPLPVERFGRAPLDRPMPEKIASPEPTVRVAPAVPPVLPARVAGLRPTAPPERVPVSLGAGAEAAPQKPTLPETPGVKAKAPDVNQPPPLPALGRQTADRASLDDPTAESANAAIVSRPAGMPWVVAGFLRLVLPDPFELGEQVKPKVPPPAEPGLSPVPVNPQRVR